MIRPEWKPGDPKATNADEKMDVEASEGTPPSSPEPVNVAPKSAVSATTMSATEKKPMVPVASADDMDDIAAELSSLSLVPHSIRFGRGGNAGGLRGRGGKKAISDNQRGDEVEQAMSSGNARVLGGGKRPPSGRGAGHGYAVVSKDSTP